MGRNIVPYDRRAAVAYAHKWAFGRNPAFYDFSEIGGDCTNFASQCLYAGTGIMNFTPELGWFYRSPNDRTPSWTGVTFLYDFLTRGESTPGPFAVESSMGFLMPGDLIQLRFADDVFGHTPVVVAVGNPPAPHNILVAAHTYDADNRPLSTYSYREIRFLHVLGAWRGDGI